MKRFVTVLLALATVLSLAGCAMVGDIAGKAAEAAKAEVEKQVQQTLRQYKLEAVETKTAFGALNDEGGKLQFFCAVLVKCETESMVEGCVKALDTVFEKSGYMRQTGSKVESEYLTNKEILFDHADYTDGTYYLVYGYISAFSGK